MEPARDIRRLQLHSAPTFPRASPLFPLRLRSGIGFFGTFVFFKFANDILLWKAMHVFLWGNVFLRIGNFWAFCGIQVLRGFGREGDRISHAWRVRSVMASLLIRGVSGVPCFGKCWYTTSISTDAHNTGSKYSNMIHNIHCYTSRYRNRTELKVWYIAKHQIKHNKRYWELFEAKGPKESAKVSEVTALPAISKLQAYPQELRQYFGNIAFGVYRSLRRVWELSEFWESTMYSGIGGRFHLFGYRISVDAGCACSLYARVCPNNVDSLNYWWRLRILFIRYRRYGKSPNIETNNIKTRE